LFAYKENASFLQHQRVFIWGLHIVFGIYIAATPTLWFYLNHTVTTRSTAMQTLSPLLANEKLLSVRSVLLRLPISRTTLWRKVKQGEIKIVHIGARRFMAESELQRILIEGTK
jgi:predicted DNA-binding transcriptional regulator AlpA